MSGLLCARVCVCVDTRVLLYVVLVDAATPKKISEGNQLFFMRGY